MDLKPAELIKKAAETILALNKEIDLDDLIYNTGECCKFYGTLKQHTDLLAEICRNSYSNGPQNLSPNSVARYIFPNCNKLDTVDKIRYILKRRKKDGQSIHAKMRSYFHALLDSQSKNWLTIAKTDFIIVGFDCNDVEKYFVAIYNTLFRQRQSKCSFLLI